MQGFPVTLRWVRAAREISKTAMQVVKNAKTDEVADERRNIDVDRAGVVCARSQVELLLLARPEPDRLSVLGRVGMLGEFEHVPDLF